MATTNWLLARAEIVAVLTGVKIDAPQNQTLKKVYAHPTTFVNDLPCVMIVGVAKGEPQRSMGLRQREYTARLRLIVEEADIDAQDDLIDAFEEAITDAFDANLTLNGKVSNLNGPQWLEPGPVNEGGLSRAGADGLVRFTMTDAPVFDA